MVTSYDGSEPDWPGKRDGKPIPAIHLHNNPVTGETANGWWPCPQCAALGRTVPLTYVSDGGTIPDNGCNMSFTEVPPERLEAYLASFPSAPSGDGRPGRKARRKAERDARRGQRRTGGVR